MRMQPNKKYIEHPCSYVAAGCAWEDLTGYPFIEPWPDKLHDDGYLPLEPMNRYLRVIFTVKKKVYFKRNARPLLKDFLKDNPGPMVICVLGHCIYARNGDYVSFFNNDDDPVVCVWFLEP